MNTGAFSLSHVGLQAYRCGSGLGLIMWPLVVGLILAESLTQCTPSMYPPMRMVQARRTRGVVAILAAFLRRDRNDSCAQLHFLGRQKHLPNNPASWRLVARWHGTDPALCACLMGLPKSLNSLFYLQTMFCASVSGAERCLVMTGGVWVSFYLRGCDRLLGRQGTRSRPAVTSRNTT
eukprot:2045458-Rhodomonas_salina.5